jgi:GNAT superfamily N-acetyltransferase
MNFSHLSFRKAQETDLKAIIALLLDDVLAQTREQQDEESYHSYQKAFREIEADVRHGLMVIEYQHQIIGTCHLTLLPSLGFQGTTRLNIEEVRVANAFRGQGIGQWMMKQAMQWGQERGAGIAQLTTNKKRTQAKHFYEQLGFQATHEGMKLYFNR